MSKTIHRFAAIEQKLDTVLFRRPDEEQISATPRTADPMKIVGGAVGVATGGAAALYGRSLLQRSVAPMVNDRLSGLRMTTPGFTGKTPAAQTAAAVGGVLKDKPLQAAGAVGSTVVADAKSALEKLKTSAGGKGFLRSRGQGGSLIASLRRGAGSGVAAMTGGRVRFSAPTNQRIISLAAKCHA